MHWILADASVSESFVTRLIEAAINNPTTGLFLLSLLVYYLSTRSVSKDLQQSREMLFSLQRGISESQKAGDVQENKALDMATNAINKIDRVADAITDMADSMRESSKDYAASAQVNAEAHVKITNTLVDRIASMDEKRAEDEIYSNGQLMRQIDDSLTAHKQEVTKVVSTILVKAEALHDQTREAIVKNNELLLGTLQESTADKSESPAV